MKFYTYSFPFQPISAPPAPTPTWTTSWRPTTKPRSKWPRKCWPWPRPWKSSLWRPETSFAKTLSHWKRRLIWPTGTPTDWLWRQKDSVNIPRLDVDVGFGFCSLWSLWLLLVMMANFYSYFDKNYASCTLKIKMYIIWY